MTGIVHFEILLESFLRLGLIFHRRTGQWIAQPHWRRRHCEESPMTQTRAAVWSSS